MFDEFFFKWYPGRYREDTRHLTAEQDGIYRRLIDEYMETRKPLPDNPVALARIAGTSVETLVAALVELRLFFEPKDGYLSHRFCDKMLDEQDSYVKKQSDRGKRSAEKRRKLAIDKQGTFNTGSTSVPTTASTKEKEEREEEERKKKAKKERNEKIEKTFEEFWQAYPKNTGSKKKARESYERVIANGEESIGIDALTNAVIQGARKYCAYISRTGSLIAHASTWLNQERWETDYSIPTGGAKKPDDWQNESDRIIAEIDAGTFDFGGVETVHRSHNAALPNAGELRENSIEPRDDSDGVLAVIPRPKS